MVHMHEEQPVELRWAVLYPCMSSMHLAAKSNGAIITIQIIPHL